jgi:hypothetical protein
MTYVSNFFCFCRDLISMADTVSVVTLLHEEFIFYCLTLFLVPCNKFSYMDRGYGLVLLIQRINFVMYQHTPNSCLSREISVQSIVVAVGVSIMETMFNFNTGEIECMLLLALLFSYKQIANICPQKILQTA